MVGHFLFDARQATPQNRVGEPGSAKTDLRKAAQPASSPTVRFGFVVLNGFPPFSSPTSFGSVHRFCKVLSDTSTASTFSVLAPVGFQISPGEDNLAGALSHPMLAKPECHYIGPLSRFQAPVEQSLAWDHIALVSGPEPQRGKLEMLLEEQLAVLPGKHPAGLWHPGSKNRKTKRKPHRIQSPAYGRA